jgi:hypothetical protein
MEFKHYLTLGRGEEDNAMPEVGVVSRLLSYCAALC